MVLSRDPTQQQKRLINKAVSSLSVELYIGSLICIRRYIEFIAIHQDSFSF